MKTPRLALRFKMLLVMSVVLVLAFGTYLYLATSLFTQDKLAYVHDLNRTLASSVAEQTGSHLDLLRREIYALAHNPTKENFTQLLMYEGEILRVQLEDADFVNTPLQQELGLMPDDMQLIRDLTRAERKRMRNRAQALGLFNASIEPDLALLTLVLRLENGKQAIVDILHQRFISIFDRSELHETFLMGLNGRIIAHPRASMVLQRKSLNPHSLSDMALESQFSQGTSTFQRDGIEYIGAFARVSLGTGNTPLDLWVITQTPRAEALRASRELIERSLLFGVAIMLAAFIISILFSRYLTSAIEDLRRATGAIGKGDFDVKVKKRTNDEIGDLALAFGQMGEAIKRTQALLVQSEKMAVFGQLGAGITHEIKNPMTGIIGFAQLAQRKVDNPEKMTELLVLIEREGLRCRKILDNFLKFAHVSEDRLRTNVNELMTLAGKVVQHQLSIHGVRLHIQPIEPAVFVMANPGEMQQVLMNLAINAQQAMGKSGGDLYLSAELELEPEDVNLVLIKVRDNGPGIPADIVGRIFEPFFSTKPSGEGTGLGLSVSFGIVAGHKGSLTVHSNGSEGTEFVITLPVASKG